MRDRYPSIACSKCGFSNEGAHYNIWCISKGGVEGLRDMFPKGQANSMNFVLFSTSGVHGTYITIEEIESSLKKYGDSPSFLEDKDADVPDDYVGNNLTVTVYHPRIIGVGYGNVTVKLEDIDFLKALRASSWAAVAKIGSSEGE